MPYRFAIIGCGNIAGRHAAAIQHCGTLSAVCDTNSEKANTLASQFGIKSYSSETAMLQEIKPDIVAVCTPNGLHINQVTAALKAASHVICEKPLATRSEDAFQMLELANRMQKKLFVVKQNRYNPVVLAIKKLLDEGRLGRIHNFQVNCFWNRPYRYYQQSWHGTQTLDGGILFTQFSHFIDLVYWFLGEIEHVSGWRGNFCHKNIIEFEDAGVANLIMKSGAIGNLNYTVNVHDSNMEGSITLFGDKGTVKIGGPYLNRITHFSVENEDEPVTGEPVSPVNAHQRVYEEMIRSLNEDKNASVDGAEAIKSIEMIEQIYRSSPFIIGQQS